MKSSIGLCEGVRLRAYMFIAEWRAIIFGQVIYDLQRGAVPTVRAEATEGGGIPPAASGEVR